MPTCIWSSQALLGETPFWDDRSRRLVFIDGDEGRIHSCSADGSDRRTIAVPPPIGFVAAGERGGLWAGLGLTLTPIAEDTPNADDTLGGAALATLPGDPQALRLNDVGIDPEGCLWTGTMDLHGRSPIGALYRITPRGVVSEQARQFMIPNGFRFSPEGRHLYVADSPRRTVFRYERDAAGNLGERRVFTVFGERDGYPDGMAVDEEACLWVAHYDGGCVTRFGPDAAPLLRLTLPASRVTALCFGGEDRRTLFITTARRNLSETALRREANAGGVFAWTAPVRGAVTQAFGY